MKTHTTVLALAVLAVGAVAQDKPVEAQKLSRDDAAAKMLEKHDAAIYRPISAGLKDLQFSFKTPMPGIVITARWKAPDKQASDVVITDEAGGQKKQLEIMLPVIKQQLAPNVSQILKLFVGEPLAALHAGDDLARIDATHIKVTARSERSKKEFKEQTIEFDERGVVKGAKVTSPSDSVTEFEATTADIGGGKLAQTGAKVTMRAAAKAPAPKAEDPASAAKTAAVDQVTTITLEYGDVGALKLLKKVVTTSKEGSNTLDFFDIKANSGLDDKLFETK